jgi:YD repeat-containing protein
MKAVLCLYFVFSFLFANSQDNPLEFNLNKFRFDRKEIKDSGYKKVVITKENFPPFNNKIKKPDTVYIAHFSGDLLIADTVKDYNEYYSREFFYDDHNNLVKRRNISTTTFPYKASDTSILEFENEKPVRLYEHGYVKYYQYSQNKLISISWTDPGSQYQYYYNKAGQMVKETQILSYDGKKDSMITTYEYDKAGNETKMNRQPSKTYAKNFPPDCWVGIYDYHERRYDSQNRIVFETDSDSSKMKTVSWGWNYKKRIYNGAGFVEEVYNSKDGLTGTNVYSVFQDSAYYFKIQKESFNQFSQVTYFLSLRSGLPSTIIDQYPGMYLTYKFYYFRE